MAKKAGKPNSKPNPCRKHNGEHEWKDCSGNHKNQKTNKPKDNKQNKNNNKRKKNKKGKENYSTEHTLTANKKYPSKRLIVALSTPKKFTTRIPLSEQPRTS